MQLIYIAGRLYKSESQLAEEFDLSVRTIQTRKKEIKAEIEKGRYKNWAVIEDGPKIVAIHYVVWVDYMNNRQKLKQKNTRKLVESFDVRELTRQLGLYDLV